MTLSRDGLIWCEDERRSGVLRQPGHPLNGIDFVEYRRDPITPPGALEVTFLKAPPPLVPTDFEVIGGIRVVDVRVTAVSSVAGEPLMRRVAVDREGDFSTYVLRVAHAT